MVAPVTVVVGIFFVVRPQWRARGGATIVGGWTTAVAKIVVERRTVEVVAQLAITRVTRAVSEPVLIPATVLAVAIETAGSRRYVWRLGVKVVKVDVVRVIEVVSLRPDAVTSVHVELLAPKVASVPSCHEEQAIRTYMTCT